jgi:hypothetical protein
MESVIDRVDFENISLAKLGLSELNYEEVKEINGGEPVTLTGGAALAVAAGVTVGALLVGVAVGVGIYYGVKWLMS